MTDVQKLAEILKILLLQEVYKKPGYSASKLVYEEAIAACDRIMEQGE